MSKKIEDLLASGVTLDMLIDAINVAGGRDPGRPILYHEKCEFPSCGEEFFSVTQDHFMRLNNNYPTHCPSCREVIRRSRKAELKRARYNR